MTVDIIEGGFNRGNGRTVSGRLADLSRRGPAGRAAPHITAFVQRMMPS